MIKGGKIMDKSLTIYVLSDSIGETGELLSRAALSQFNSEMCIRDRFLTQG